MVGYISGLVSRLLSISKQKDSMKKGGCTASAKTVAAQPPTSKVSRWETKPTQAPYFPRTSSQ